MKNYNQQTADTNLTENQVLSADDKQAALERFVDFLDDAILEVLVLAFPTNLPIYVHPVRKLNLQSLFLFIFLRTGLFLELSR